MPLLRGRFLNRGEQFEEGLLNERGYENRDGVPIPFNG